jgi:gluconolactonase
LAESASELIETPERIASGFVFTEGPIWHPDGYLYFVDIRKGQWYRVRPGGQPELVRENTAAANGTTFDLQGRFVMCESDNRRVVRIEEDGRIGVLAERYEGKRLNRPNDVVCKSDGSIYFTDPGLRVPLPERELPYAGIYRIALDGDLTLIADCEYPNGLAFSPDESVLYVANTRWAQYIHAINLDHQGNMTGRRIFADMSAGQRTGPGIDDLTQGVPDGMKVDAGGRVYCTGAGGTWVFDPAGRPLGIIQTPEVPANLAFGGPDLQTLFFTARTSVYALRMKVPGQPHPWYSRR